MGDKVKILSGRIIAIIDDQQEWRNAEEKLNVIRSYLLGVCDGIDYAGDKK